jgi:integrase
LATVWTTNGAHHLRIYASVDISSGKPLDKLGENGRPLRKQQTIMLVRQDNGQHKNENSIAVRILANAKEEEIRSWELSARHGEPTRPDGNMTVADFYTRVFMPQMQIEKTPSTIKSYRGYWDAYLKDHFNGSKTLKSYEPFTGTNFLEGLATRLSYNTVSHVRAVASAIFAYATVKGFIPRNPWQDVRKRIKCQDVEETVAYERKDIERILDTLERVTGRETYSAQMAGMVVSTCFFAGLRPSEAAGLRWENVDVDKGTIHVCQSFVVGKHRATTKTDENRTVVMLPTLRHRLKIWAMTNQHPKTGLVFPNQRDTPININHLSTRIIGPTLAKVGLEWHGLYSCRRGFGTELFNAGATMEEIAAAMGNSPQVAFANYVKDKSRSGASGIAKLAAMEHAAGHTLALGAGTEVGNG